MRRACSTMASGSSARSPAVGLLPEVALPFVERVGAVFDAVTDGAAEQVTDREANCLALDIQRGDLEGGKHPVCGAAAGDHAAHPVPSDEALRFRGGVVHSGSSGVSGGPVYC